MANSSSRLSELQDLFSARKADQKCSCSFCSPSIDHATHEPIRKQGAKSEPIRKQGAKSEPIRKQGAKSDIYDRIPPLIPTASAVNKDLKGIPSSRSLAAELAKKSELPEDYMVRAPEEHVDNASASKRTPSSEKQITCSCSFCAKSFTTTRALELHVRRHSGLRPYPCKFCDKCFYQPSERAVHMRTHTGARPYRCPHCLKLFRYSGDLKQHINIHTGQRPYQCEICAKAFTNHSTLRQHKRIHTGERPYRCEECGKTYRYHSSLKQHLSAHATKRNLQTSDLQQRG